MERDGSAVSAIIVEPMVQAAGGMLTHDAAFLQGVRALCDEFGALMIADEVATGVGRTGTMWAVEHAGVAPDLLTCGKGLTAGYLPLSAVLATSAVYEAFLGRADEGRTFFHGHTYTANPLACAAAIANLDLMASRGHGRRGRRGRATGSGSCSRRWRPSRGARDPPDRHHDRHRDRAVRAVGAGRHARCAGAARERGVIVRPLGDVVVLMPPLGDRRTTTSTLLVDVVSDSVREVLAELG